MSNSFMTPWTIARQVSMWFPRQEYWSGLPFPPPGDLHDPGIEPASPALAGVFFTTSATWEAPACMGCMRAGVSLTIGIESCGWTPKLSMEDTTQAQKMFVMDRTKHASNQALLPATYEAQILCLPYYLCYPFCNVSYLFSHLPSFTLYSLKFKGLPR